MTAKAVSARNAPFDPATRSKSALQVQPAGGLSTAGIKMSGAAGASRGQFSVSHSSTVAPKNASGFGAAVGVGASAIQPQAAVVVKDEEGNDVTPLSLLGGTKSGNKSLMTDLLSGSVKESVSDVLNDLESTNMTSWNSSHFGGRQSVTSSHTSDISDDDRDATDSTEAIDRTTFGQSATDNSIKSSKLDSYDSQQMVHIKLIETDTILLLNLPSLAVCPDLQDEVASVKASNEVYSNLCATKSSNENFAERGVQTINPTKKNKDVQASGPTFASSECQANQWSIYDASHASSSAKTDEHAAAQDDLVHASQATSVATLANELSHIIGTSGSVAAIRSSRNISSQQQSMSVDYGASESGRNSIAGRMSASGDAASVGGDDCQREASLLATLNQENLINSLLVMERAIVGNTYETKLLQYRNVSKSSEPPPIVIQPQINIEHGSEFEEAEEEIEEDTYGSNIPTLSVLWTYRCELTRGRTVTHMTWNKQNEDILAVAYGESRTSTSSSEGLILCWTLKNPEWPERIYKPAQAVTAIDFSKHTPNLLAAGFADGRIAIYDVRQKKDVEVLDNDNIPGKHHDPIWELKWIEQERGISDEQTKAEMLVSVSTDGRVCQWQIKKGFEHSDLMVLKRVNKQAGSVSASSENQNRAKSASRDATGGSAGKPAALISRHSGGLCFDFNYKDKNM
ncbi:WD repeat-containing protein 78 [Entophlyctis sp. JEL0112]|nr:WD repeat-containing protein 78 [Entophlyctis sp. JEL0112]